VSGRARLQPLHSSPFRAVAEAVTAYAILLFLGAALNGFALWAGAVLSGLLIAFGWIVLCVWPAWRTRPVRTGPWWSRLGRGIGRAVLIILALALSTVILTWLSSHIAPFWPLAGFTVARSPAILVVLGVGFALARVAVLAGAWGLAHTRRHLRWQLMTSHVAVIVLTFAALTALGSVVAIGVALHAVQPNSIEMARSIREQLQLTGRPLDPQRAQRVFLAIDSGTLPQRGQPPLSFLVGSLAVPQGLGLLAPNGRVLAATERGQGVLPAHRWSQLPGITASIWQPLRTAALRGQATSLRIHFPGTGAAERSDLAEVPIRTAPGRTAAILLVAAGGPTATTTQFFQAVVVLFGATTIALIGIAGLPLLAVSFLFSYFVARGLTRRLEAVSRVATAVAAGNFAERAPIRSQDEVGQLAEDVNRMAGRLERLVAELTQARSQAEDALRTRQQLVANVSHELRTPLAVLHAHLESVAARDAVPAGGTDHAEVSVPASTIDTLRGETFRLAAMIDDLFALSRAETGSLALDRRPVDVGAVIDEVVRFMRPLAQRESAVTLTSDVSPGLPPVPADPGRLHQILSNLVRNAVRHTPEGGIVVLAAHREGEDIALAVSDTGEGIAADDLPHVFERFYRADPSRTRETGGAGLGLAIVRELVELMGGRVRVASVPGSGSTFTVYLPTASTAPESLAKED